MAITLPNLGLKVWNAPTDPYNSSQLADNWYRVDEHDHSPGKGRPLSSNSLADLSVTQAKLANASVGTAQLIDANVTAAKLADDIVSARRVVLTKLLLSGATGSAATFVSSFAAALTATNTAAALQAVFKLDPTHYASAGRSTSFRLATSTVSGSTSPSTTYTYNVYPVTAVTNTSITLGTAVAGSTVIATPGSASLLSGQSSTFTLNASTAYAIGVALSGTEAASSVVVHHMQLQVHQS